MPIIKRQKSIRASGDVKQESPTATQPKSGKLQTPTKIPHVRAQSIHPWDGRTKNPSIHPANPASTKLHHNQIKLQQKGMSFYPMARGTDMPCGRSDRGPSIGVSAGDSFLLPSLFSSCRAVPVCVFFAGGSRTEWVRVKALSLALASPRTRRRRRSGGEGPRPQASAHRSSGLAISCGVFLRGSLL